MSKKNYKGGRDPRVLPLERCVCVPNQQSINVVSDAKVVVSVV